MMNKIGVGGGTDTSQINGNDGTLKAKVDAENKTQMEQDSEFIKQNYSFIHPVSGEITSGFGSREETEIISAFHQGIDIPAPEGTKLYALDDATIIFASWGAGGGYTITGESLNFPEIKFSYCHCSPIFLVNKGDMVKKGDLIATVGPKNVYGIQNNQYKDSNGLPTNGATTGCHLHFALKVNNKNVNPLDYFQTLEYDNNEIIEKENKENE